ncbi:LysR substrate-binding domain-containing protein [Stenotrophomonas sp. Iso1]|uniref:LysR substrate-binding domain-containing protein n=1 Tax=Stenotrophomonas sp. Iso1 TaxID=2977283 RepID=UPI0022B7847F|nr:LysR substrate-binding domain-containing protein [Stenotrophomonas sp. Iso1]
MGAVLPLLALRAFVETARHGTLKAAADAMGVTSGAISQQLKLLQERTGVVLFERTRQGVMLSAAGTRIYPELKQAFDQIESSLRTLERLKGRQTLRISAAPSFAATWLAPRLPGFSAQHPQIDVHLDATTQRVDLRRDGVDIAIRHGLGRYPGVRADHLFAPVLLPVASPALLATAATINTAEDCLQLPLLQDADRNDWRLWFQSMDIAADPRMERGPAFDDDLLLIRAAEASQGIALVRDIHAASEIAAGRLAVAINLPWPQTFAYYALSLPAEEQLQPCIPLFLSWLREQLALPVA